jgi:DNA-binding GntR family transcriptional regulator
MTELSVAAGIEPAPSTRTTQAERLRAEIADEIVSGHLAPGVALDEMELAHRFQVSRTPVREAIRLLASSGLVQARPHRSAVVARPSPDELAAMFEALCELEVLCAGLAAERMSAADCTALADINARLIEVLRADDAQRYHEINQSFHAAIYAGARNPHLAAITAATRGRIAPYSRLQFRTAGRLQRSWLEHEEIVRAIQRRDRPAVEAAMRTHIGQVLTAAEARVAAAAPFALSTEYRSGSKLMS